ncbi:putative sugar transporter [Tilletiaria anomala UBC 951]|uniref:Putative sugar transporter n=1 Tax=Tilletiaria anomala (strain ATCC 24038 / CBS 436.72 / UBC 951) TaxID=1037660 RepID=A0A066VHC9_TILAU|nr:putative sugar transporter [Tilletiaria anomala UBC 951]KDN37980.1 putative sugar transporter [Tilletiaria anomala UBC 951]
MASCHGASIVSTTVGQSGWIAAFGPTADPTAPDYSRYSDVTAATNGLFAGGGAAGFLLCMVLFDLIGRKRLIQLGAFVEIIAAALQAGCVPNNLAMSYAARFLSGLSIGMLVTSVPLFQAGLAKPMGRGLEVGFHAMFLVGGYFLLAWIGFGCYFGVSLNFSWRFPLAVLCIPPTALLLVSPWVPFSPRWLFSKGRMDEAWITLAAIHVRGGVAIAGATPPASEAEAVQRFADSASQGRYNVALANEEYRQITDQIAHEKEREASHGNKWQRVLSVPSFRKRLLTGFLVQFGGQPGGPLVINNSSFVIYSNLGMSGWKPFLLIALWLTTAIFWNILGANIMGRIGRRTAMLVGIAACCILVAVEAALTAAFASTDNKVSNGFAISIIFLYLAFQGTLIDCSMYLYVSETFPMQIRAIGNGFSLFGQFAGTRILLQTASLGFQSVGLEILYGHRLLQLRLLLDDLLCLPRNRG